MLLKRISMENSLQMMIMERSLMLLIPLFLQQPNTSLATHHFGKIGRENYYQILSVELQVVQRHLHDQSLHQRGQATTFLVRDKIHSHSTNIDIPYESLSYGQLNSYVQKVALKFVKMTKSKDNQPRRKPKAKEIQGLSVSNLDCQLAQNKRKKDH